MYKSFVMMFWSLQLTSFSIAECATFISWLCGCNANPISDFDRHIPSFDPYAPCSGHGQPIRISVPSYIRRLINDDEPPTILEFPNILLALLEGQRLVSDLLRDYVRWFSEPSLPRFILSSSCFIHCKQTHTRASSTHARMRTRTGIWTWTRTHARAPVRTHIRTYTRTHARTHTSRQQTSRPQHEPK